MSDNNNIANIGAKAQIDFCCLDDNCNELIKFNLAEISQNHFQAICPKCHKTYAFDDSLRDKLIRMFKLIVAIREAEDILGQSNVSVNVAGGSVKVPYVLLLTRLNTLLTLEVAGKKVDFHLWIEPASQNTFR